MNIGVSAQGGATHKERQGLQRFVAGEPLEDQLTASRLNMILEFLESLQPLDGVDISHARYHHGTISFLKNKGPLQLPACRFEIIVQGATGKVYIADGTVFFCDEDERIFSPYVPTLDEDGLPINSDPIPKWNIDDLPTGLVEIWIKFGMGEGHVFYLGPADELPTPPKGVYLLKIGEFEVKARDEPTEDGRYQTIDTSTLVQWLCSDIIESDKDTGSSSNSISDSSESSGSSIPSNTESSGSGKTGIIPVPIELASTGFLAVFIMEMAEPRIEEVMRIPIKGRTKFRAKLDDRYRAVCESGTLDICGWASDQPCLVGLTVDDRFVSAHVEDPLGMNPEHLVVRVTAIRRGFLGVRFPEKTAKEFQANEAFLSMAIPK